MNNKVFRIILIDGSSTFIIAKDVTTALDVFKSNPQCIPDPEHGTIMNISVEGNVFPTWNK